jgi:hypothetical protein
VRRRCFSKTCKREKGSLRSFRSRNCAGRLLNDLAYSGRQKCDRKISLGVFGIECRD